MRTRDADGKKKKNAFAACLSLVQLISSTAGVTAR